MEAVAIAKPSVPASCEVAIIGAGPVGLMVANLLGMAGVDVVVLERNHGLVGLPRAIAYDAETLRLFAQIGLFNSIADGLIQDPKVVYLNARGAKLMEMNPPRGPFGHSPLGTFFQPSFERALLQGLHRFASARALFAHEVDVDRPGRARGRLEDRLARRRMQPARAIRRRLRRRDQPDSRGDRRAPRRVDLCRALARGRREDRKSWRRQNHLLLRSAPAGRSTAGGGLARALGVHAIAGRAGRNSAARRNASIAARAIRGLFEGRNRTTRGLRLPRARRRQMAQGARAAGGRRGASDAPVRGAGDEQRYEGRGQPGLEDRRRGFRRRRRRDSQFL